MKAALLSLALLLAPSCAMARTTDNRPLEAEALARLVPGTTTAKDVVATLGAPVDVVQLGKRSAYLYRHTASKRAGLWLVVVAFYNVDERSDRIWVFFDEAGVLTHVGATLIANQAEYAMPYEELHD